MARNSPFRQRMVAARRKTFWIAGVVTSNTAVTAATQLTTLNAAALALRPFTVIRSRGWVSFGSDQVGIDELQVVHYGATVVSQEADSIGVTAMPAPGSSNGSDWFVYTSGAMRFEFGTAVGINPDMTNRLEFDSKAMRKVEEGSTVVTIVEPDAASSGIRVIAFNRILIKLH